MKHGTRMNEITESLPNGDIIRILGNGWKPRSRSIEIITEKYGIVKITDYDSMKALSTFLTEFLKSEKGRV